MVLCNGHLLSRMFSSLLLLTSKEFLPSSNPSLEYSTASWLYLIVFLEHLIEENRVGGSVQSSVENKAKSVKVPDVPEGDGTQQNNDESDTLPSSQAEVGKGPQKKSLTKRKDQRGPESLDSQTKPWTRSTAPLYRRTQGTQSPGDKESTASAQLRRNVSSAGRLQGLYNNAPGRRESKKAEVYVYLPSGKKRPRSLEITTYSREGEPPNSEVLPTQEETRNGPFCFWNSKLVLCSIQWRYKR